MFVSNVLSRVLIISASILSLAGCQTMATDIPFDAAEASFIKNAGTTKITGHAFRQHFPRPINSAGEVVRLIPVTAYSHDRFEKIYSGDKFVHALLVPKVEFDPQYLEYSRSTKTESDGRFSFEGVGPGKYYIATEVTWTKDTMILPDGGIVYDEVTITGKETDPVKVILSGN